MQSLTIEYQRFGDPTGIIRLSDRYLRTIGPTAPGREVGFELPQETLDYAMGALDYGMFERADDPRAVRRTAEQLLRDMAPYLRRFLIGDAAGIDSGKPCQLDVVTRAQELAQLPFEVLEESHPDLIVTRRIRQPWPPPETVRDNTPRVLFAWAEPKRRPGSRRRMQVPHERHRELLRALLADWGEEALIEVPNATPAALAAALVGGARFTHLHLLAHGVGPEKRRVAAGERVDLERSPPPAACLALEDDDGTLLRYAPEQLAASIKGSPRPESIAVATCHSAEIDPIRAGATVAHALHAAGVPIVLASQLALTTAGSDVLIDTFLANTIEGRDPREALRAARDKLRASRQDTWYDRVALVGYIHIDPALPERLKQRSFEVALTRLGRISQDAERRTDSAVAGLAQVKRLTAAQRAEAETIRQRFAEVRERLAGLEHDDSLTGAQREELLGLTASALKREAEAAWKLSRALGGDDAQTWLSHSRSTLREAARCYRRAAGLSRDHHWSWTQWLALEAVQTGTLAGVETDWVAACAAARDAAASRAGRGARRAERQAIAEQAAWGWGSLVELGLLSTLAGHADGFDAAERATRQLAKTSKRCRDARAVDATLRQLDRHAAWWGEDPEWKLPAGLVEQATRLRASLAERAAESADA